MNYRLIATFLFSQVIEFSVFYVIASSIGDYINYPALNIFLGFVGLDIIITILVYGKIFPDFVKALLSNDDEQS
jgi:hypothetical protein